jgi:hypothetical protein
MKLLHIGNVDYNESFPLAWIALIKRKETYFLTWVSPFVKKCEWVDENSFETKSCLYKNRYALMFYRGKFTKQVMKVCL